MTDSCGTALLAGRGSNRGRKVHRRWFSVTSLVAVLAIFGCHGAPPLPPAPPASALPSAQYIIGPGDSLSIFVWRNPELSTGVPVRPDGRMTIPLVEDVVATGKTPTNLARELEQRLSKYIKEPIVTIIVTGFVGTVYRTGAHHRRSIDTPGDPVPSGYDGARCDDRGRRSDALRGRQ